MFKYGALKGFTDLLTKFFYENVLKSLVSHKLHSRVKYRQDVVGVLK